VTEGQTLAKVDDTDAAEAVSNARSAVDDAEDALAQAKTDATRSATATSSCGRNVAAAYASPSPGVSPSPGGSVSPRPSATPSRTKTPAKPQTSAPAGGGRTGGRTGGTPGGENGTPGGENQCTTGGQQKGPGGDAILSAQQRLTQATTTLENAERALDGTTITAPIAGKVLSVTGNVGNQVNAGSSFITLADVYDMQISADFPEADADHLAVRQKAVVALAGRPGADLKATVVQVDPTGTSDGTMVRYGVVLAFDDAPKDLLVGQSASVRVTTGDKTGVLRVPSTAVHDVAGSRGTVLKDGAQVKVGVGLRGDQYTEVTSGLGQGDAVARSW
jgi:HlyD family secretion protein